MMFTHILLTRFNLRGSNESCPPSYEWMRTRILLFKKYCFPSVCNQSNKDFKWIIYIDRSTDSSFLETLTYLCKDLPNILHVKLADSWQSVIEQSLYSDISKLIKPDSKVLITTRLDNDDAIHKNFIHDIQNEFKNYSFKDSVNKVALNLTQGYCFKEMPYELTFYRHFSNPFISLCEKLDEDRDFKTVLHKWHDHYLTQVEFPLIQLDTHPYWIQIIHSNNISNTVLGNPVLNKKELENFGIDVSDISFDLFFIYKNFFQRKLNAIREKLKLKS